MTNPETVIIPKAALDSYTQEIARLRDLHKECNEAIARANRRANTAEYKQQDAEQKLEQFQTILKDLLNNNFEDYNKGDGW